MTHSKNEQINSDVFFGLITSYGNIGKVPNEHSYRWEHPLSSDLKYIFACKRGLHMFRFFD